MGVDKENSWLAGCYCHEDLLVADEPGWKRRRRMMRETGRNDACCPWKGRRACAFALGEARRMAKRMAGLTSIRFQAMVATLAIKNQPLLTRILSIRLTLTTRWGDTIVFKYEIYDHIPHHICGAFAEFCGFELEEGKAAVRKCFAEHKAITDLGQSHKVSLDLFETDCAEKAQLAAFATTPSTSLMDYPDGFIAIQEYNFCDCTEHATERIHRHIHEMGKSGGFKTRLPAMTCANVRKDHLALLNGSTLHVDPSHFPWKNTNNDIRYVNERWSKTSITKALKLVSRERTEKYIEE